MTDNLPEGAVPAHILGFNTMEILATFPELHGTIEKIVTRAVDQLFSDVEDQILDLPNSDIAFFMPETDEGDDEDKFGEFIALVTKAFIQRTLDI